MGMLLEDVILSTPKDFGMSSYLVIIFYQSITSNYYNLPNDDDDDENNIPCTAVDNVIQDNKGVEDAVVPNDEDIYDEIMIDDYVRLTSAIDPLQN